MESESLRRPFHFIITGKYCGIHYDGNDFQLQTDLYYLRGSLFYLSRNQEKIIHDGNYVGYLTCHPDYDRNVFYIRREEKFFSNEGTWTDRVEDALHVQIHPLNKFEAETSSKKAPLIISDPTGNPQHPISADGVDLYHPDAWFSLYPISAGYPWMNDADEFESQLVFCGQPYSYGIRFRLSELDGKTQIRLSDERYLGVTMNAEMAEYLPEECREHNAFGRCAHCMGWYSIGSASGPQKGFTLVPSGLPSMFLLYDGVCYYQFNVIKASFANLTRVENIEAASLFQFVSEYTYSSL